MLLILLIVFLIYAPIRTNAVIEAHPASHNVRS
jgi:hypothetical protein